MALVYLALTIAGFSGLSLVMKLGTGRGYTPLGLTAWLYIAGTVFTLPGALLVDGPLTNLTLRTAGAGIVGGLCGAVAFALFVRAMKIGHFGYSVAIMPMSCIVPVAAAMIFWDARLTAMIVTGFILVLAAVFLINLSSAPADSPAAFPRQVWLVTISAAFMLNGISLAVQAFEMRGAEPRALLFLLIVYIAGAVILTTAGFRRGLQSRGAAWYGTLAGAGSVLGCYCMMMALKGYPEGVVFPVCLGGPVVTSVILSALAFKERISWQGWAGIVCGIAAIVVLTL